MKALLALTCAILLAYGTSGAEDSEPVTIGGVTYDYVDPGEPFKQRPRPAQDWELPKPTAAEKKAGMVAYVTGDPGDYKPDRLPRPEEHATKLSAVLAQGEYEPIWFGVHAVAALSDLAVNVEVGSAPVSVDVRHMHFWPQRTGWRSREWYMTPELLLPCREGKKLVPAERGVLEERPFNLKSGETAAFWLTLHAAADARPGIYDASVTLASSGRPALTIPLQTEVLPFKLQRPKDRHWLLYCDSRRWRTMNEDQVLAELDDFARHGMTGLVEMPLGSEDLSGIKDGAAKFDAAAFKKLAAQCEQAGLPGPHVCSYGGTPQRVRDALGLKCDVSKEQWPEELKAGVEAVARAAVEATKDAPAKWLFYGVDEPSGDNTYAIQEYQSWRKGGATTYATFYNLGFLDKASEYLTAPCFVSGLVSRESSARAAREGCARTGAEFWWYGTGSYVNPFSQEGFMFHNRYGAGYLFWKSGAQAEVSWTFCRPHEDVFNDFDGIRVNPAEPKEQATAYPHLLKPDDWSTYQGAIPTIAWESLREGVDDYTYLHMLTSLIAEARNSKQKATRETAKKVEETLSALVDAIPWANPMAAAPAPDSGFGTRHMQHVRRAVADLIVDLQAAVAGTVRKATRQREASVTVIVRTVESDRGTVAALPVIPVMPTGTPPKIDGVLDDPCWQEGTAADTFRHSKSARLAATPTEARIAYDERALYVAFSCHEPAMDKLVAKQHGHDTQMVWLDDGIELFVAGSDRSKYAHVIVNTNGSVYDEVGQNPSWDPAIDVGLQRGRDHWAVELAMPWADLKQAGLLRSPVMAVNFCRNRFADTEESPHSAWSCTFGGFHVPERFGVALLQEEPVALADLQVPSLWGKQSVAVKLRNLTDAPLAAQAGLLDGRMHAVRLPAGSTREVKLPIDLLTPGPVTTTMAWGVVGQPVRKVALSVAVPEPISVAGGPGFVADGDTMEMPIRLNIAPGERAGYRIRVAAPTAEGPLTVELPSKPGERKHLVLPVRGMIRLRACLVGEDGEPVGATINRVIFPLSR